MRSMKIFLDDEREPGYLRWYLGYDDVVDSEWTVVRTYKDFVDTVNANLNNIEAISFDHDIGANWNQTLQRHHNGLDAVTYIEELCYYKKLTNIPHMMAHSANPVGCQQINQTINRINQAYKT